MIGVNRTENPKFASVLTICSLLAVAFAPAEALAQAVVVGWIDNTDAGSLVAISRHGGSIAYDDQAGLQACDKLKLLEPDAIVRITLTNKERLRLDARTPELELPCKQAGVTTKLAAFLRALLFGVDSRRRDSVTAASRSFAQVKPLTVPALARERTLLAAGERALYLTWRGGKAPYSVQIRGFAEGAAAVTMHGVSAHSTRLPSARYVDGRYALIITDQTGRTLRDEELYVVAGAALPAMPDELMDAAIPESARRLYYADYLMGFEDGRFGLEALQVAAAVTPPTDVAHEWLAAWGDAD